jgi:hypothetical protein
MSRVALILAAAATLWTGPVGAFEVFQSKTNSAADRGVGAVQNGAGVTNLNIWIDTKEGGVGNANPGNPALACSGPGSSGDYSCAWGLEFVATGDMEIAGFTPQQAGDYVVMHPTSFPAGTKTLRMNGGKPTGPVYELDELRIGTLQVRATGPTGELRLNNGSSVDTLLNELAIAGTPKVLAVACGTGTSDGDCDGLQGAADNCPNYAQQSSADTDADGRGNECECTDQNGDGRNTVADLVAINLAIFNPSLVTPLCDGNNDGACNVNDIIAANVEIFSPTSTSICARQPVPGP